MSCPSRFELARRFGSRTQGELAVHLGWCGRCQRAVEELASSRRELFEDDEEKAAAIATRKLLAAVSLRRAERRRRFFFAFLPAALAAACLAVWLRPSAEGVRAKGELAVELFCKRGEVVFPAKDGGDFFPGDRLRFAYTSSEAGYLVVFGVDDGGSVFPYYPQRNLAGLELPAGKKVLLPGSIELDAHRGWERTFALWSRTPLDEREIRARVNETLTAAGGDLRRAARLQINLPQVSHLLRRP